MINPTLLVEVTSSSTEGYDRGEKLSHYKQIPSLVAVLLVSHRRRQVTVVERTSDGWEQRELRAGELVTVEALALSMSVAELYVGARHGCAQAPTSKNSDSSCMSTTSSPFRP